MVEEDAYLAVHIHFVAEGVFNFGLISSFGASEVVVAHGNGNVTSTLCLVVLKHDI